METPWSVSQGMNNCMEEAARSNLKASCSPMQRRSALRIEHLLSKKAVVVLVYGARVFLIISGVILSILINRYLVGLSTFS